MPNVTQYVLSYIRVSEAGLKTKCHFVECDKSVIYSTKIISVIKDYQNLQTHRQHKDNS